MKIKRNTIVQAVILVMVASLFALVFFMNYLIPEIVLLYMSRLFVFGFLTAFAYAVYRWLRSHQPGAETDPKPTRRLRGLFFVVLVSLALFLLVPSGARFGGFMLAAMAMLFLGRHAYEQFTTRTGSRLAGCILTAVTTMFAMIAIVCIVPDVLSLAFNIATWSSLILIPLGIALRQGVRTAGFAIALTICILFGSGVFYLQWYVADVELRARQFAAEHGGEYIEAIDPDFADVLYSLYERDESDTTLHYSVHIAEPQRELYIVRGQVTAQQSV